MATVNMLEAKSSLSRLVEAVESGAEREIIIARSTGRNPASVLALRQDEDEYERALCRLELGI